MFYCYALSSQKTGQRYVGSCENLTERIRRHNAGESKATKHGVPWVLTHSESFATRSEAAQRERYYKTGRGRDQLEKQARAVAAATGRGFKSHQPNRSFSADSRRCSGACIKHRNQINRRLSQTLLQHGRPRSFDAFFRRNCWRADWHRNSVIR
jgi:putative endonuclease